MTAEGLTGVSDLLRCPRCGAALRLDGRVLRCAAGHAFDIARQGYVNLTGAAPPAHADTAAMITERAALLASGRYGVVVETVLALIPDGVRVLLDVGTGTGHYAAAVLRARPSARGLGLDVSVAACRRAARAHPRLGVITADAWAGLPVASAEVDVVLSVFSPRHPAEFRRVLAPGGSVITVTPTAEHLVELRAPFGLLEVESAKQDRLTASLGRAGLIMVDERPATVREEWSAEDAVRAIMMGPNAFHRSRAEVEAVAAALAWPGPVTVSCRVSRWQGPPPGAG